MGIGRIMYFVGVVFLFGLVGFENGGGDWGLGIGDGWGKKGGKGWGFV